MIDKIKNKLTINKKIRDKAMSDVEVSKLLLKINQKYPDDIDDQFGVRNIIDQQFERKTLTYFRI